MHSYRAADIAEKFSKYLNLEKDKANSLILATKYHDVGKGVINQSILFKNGKLTEEELKEIKKHSLLSFLLLSENENIDNDVLIPILEHHEKIDGSGYPYGKRGEDISFGGKFLALCDSYEAMTGHRGYRQSLSKDEAIDEIMNNLGIQFDKVLGEQFILFLRNSNMSTTHHLNPSGF